MTDEKMSPAVEKIPRRGQFSGCIVDQNGQGEHYRRLVLEIQGPAARCLARAKSGQFIQIACRDLSQPRRPTPLLRRPFSLGRVSLEAKDGFEKTIQPGENPRQLYIEILYRLIGPATLWLAQCPRGHQLDFLGPLGNGFTLPADKKKKCILVGGGIGLPPLFFLADQLRASGHEDLVAFAGERTKTRFGATLDFESYDAREPLTPQNVMLEFACGGTASIITTDDGSAGFAGHVVAALEGFLERNPVWRTAAIYACGPTIMMKETAALALRRDMACQICLEAYMSCGIGLCQSCAVPIASSQAERFENHGENQPGEYKLTCTNGPVFDARRIDWNYL
jgi:dihydroorotate dehydrogenase electron transfer subunit